MTVAVIVAGLWLIVAAVGHAKYLRAGGGPRRGLAGAFEVHRAMSGAAMRRRADQTRPGSTIHPGVTNLVEVGIELGRVGRHRILAALEDVVVVLGGVGSGKSGLLMGVLARWRYAAVVTSTKPDLISASRAAREGRPVWVFNPEGIGGVPNTLWWNIPGGCSAPETTLNRAGHLVSGSDSTGGGGGNSQFFEGNAARVLAALLMAADLGGYRMRHVYRWSLDTTSTDNYRPLVVLQNEDSDVAAGWANMLRTIYVEAEHRQRTAISSTLTLCLMFMADERIAAVTDPPANPDDAYTVEAHLRRRGEVHLIGRDRQYGAVSPLFAALTGYMFEGTAAIADRCPRGRLPDPMLWCLDEAALICRAPFDRWIAEARSRGMVMMLAAQSRAQMDKAWGSDTTTSILGNATSFVQFGGSIDTDQLDLIASLAGPRAYGDSQRPAITARDVHNLEPAREAIVVHRQMSPVIARVRMAWDLPYAREVPGIVWRWFRKRRTDRAAARGERRAPVIRLADRRADKAASGSEERRAS